MQPPKTPFGPPPPERVRSISSGLDAERMARTRVRVAGMRASASATKRYHLAKADAWLDFATDAGRIEAGGDAAEDALDQAMALLGAMERGRNPPLRTLHVVASSEVHPELWATVDQIKNSAGFPCAVDPLARAEVALVWAGHKAHIGDPKGAEQMGARAQQLLDAAGDEVRRCFAVTEVEPVQPGLPRMVPVPMPTFTAAPSSVTASATAPAPNSESRATEGAAPAARHVDIVQLPTDTLFPFGATRLNAARSASLGDLAQRIRATPKLVAVRIGGHTDRLSRSGPEFNRRLAESRARAVGKALVAHGVDAALIAASGHGDTLPVVECPGRRTRAIIDCLAPNRRVVIEIERAD
ncbi:MAG: OmpA family protein [Rhodocyclales bacterium]|nr:OmpA family protein [Rhodocyclales bacterium]